MAGATSKNLNNAENDDSRGRFNIKQNTKITSESYLMISHDLHLPKFLFNYSTPI